MANKVFEQAKEQMEEEAVAERPVDTAKCSQCGSDRLGVLEGILTARAVRGINAYGEYLVNSQYHLCDDAKNTCIVCMDCNHTVEVPPDAEGSIIRYVFSQNRNGRCSMKWAIVQHSGFGYAGKPAFKQGLELRNVNERQAKTVENAGGVVFDSYPEADNYIFDEMYKNVQGMVPKAPGTFSSNTIDGLRIYLPVKETTDAHNDTT